MNQRNPAENNEFFLFQFANIKKIFEKSMGKWITHALVTFSEEKFSNVYSNP